MIDTLNFKSKSWRPASIALAGLLTLAVFNLTGCTSANARNTSMPDDVSIPVDTSVPSAKVLQGVVDEAHAKFKGLKDGKNADYIPILATIPSELFGVVIVMRDGTTYKAGDVDYAFAIESTSKPFTAALVMEQNGGPQILVDKIGVEPTGLPFNSKLAIEILKARSVNPLVNAGAMASVSLVKASSEQERWDLVLGNLSDFAGAPLTMMEEVYQSEYTTSWSNRGIVNLLYNDKRLYADPEETLRVYNNSA